jgi:cytochrome c peroxidase
MSRLQRRLVVAIGALAFGIFLAAHLDVTSAANDDALLSQVKGIFKPLPKDMATSEFPITPERVDLGRNLFFDPRISVDGTVSCARCHQPALAFLILFWGMYSLITAGARLVVRLGSFHIHGFPCTLAWVRPWAASFLRFSFSLSATSGIGARSHAFKS